MKKTLSERIAERVGKRESKPKEKNKALMLGLREEIEGALSDGWPIMAIWETLSEEGKVDFTYQAFRGHVAKFIAKRAAQPAVPDSALVIAPTSVTPVLTPKGGAEISNAPATKSAEPKASEKPSAGPGQFTFNAVPTKEDLL